MTKVVANPARGEVDVEIDGETYVLAPTFGGLARFQASMGVEGLVPLLTMTIGMDMRALLEGVRCLAVAGDIAKLDKAYFPPKTVNATQKAIIATIRGPDEGNAAGGEEGSPKLESSLPADGSK